MNRGAALFNACSVRLAGWPALPPRCPRSHGGHSKLGLSCPTKSEVPSEAGGGARFTTALAGVPEVAHLRNGPGETTPRLLEAGTTCANKKAASEQLGQAAWLHQTAKGQKRLSSPMGGGRTHWQNGANTSSCHLPALDTLEKKSNGSNVPHFLGMHKWWFSLSQQGE